MKWLLVRGGLLALLLFSLTIQFKSFEKRIAVLSAFDATRAINALIEENDLATLKNPFPAGSVLSVAVYFQRPECSEHSVVLPFALNLEALPLLTRLASPETFKYTYVYLDRQWSIQERLAMYAVWFKHAVLSYAGMTPFIPVRVVIALAEPQSCTTSKSLNWRLIWDRQWNEARAAEQRSNSVRDSVNADR